MSGDDNAAEEYTMATNTEVACPKCNGNKVLWAFRHIDNGRCFRCAGNGTILVDKELAARYAAPVTPAPRPPTIEIPGFGTCDLYADRIEVAGRFGGLPVYFERRGSRVVVTGVCNGLARRKAEVTRAVEMYVS